MINSGALNQLLKTRKKQLSGRHTNIAGNPTLSKEEIGPNSTFEAPGEDFPVHFYLSGLLVLQLRIFSVFSFI